MTTSYIIGIGASILTGISMMPQLVKTFKEKKAGDISLGMLALLLAGLGLWTWYGVEKSDWIISISNAFSFLVNAMLAVLSLKYKNKK